MSPPAEKTGDSLGDVPVRRDQQHANCRKDPRADPWFYPSTGGKERTRPAPPRDLSQRTDARAGHGIGPLPDSLAHRRGRHFAFRNCADELTGQGHQTSIVGQHNFGAINCLFHRPQCRVSGLQGRRIDYYSDNSASHWATAYDFRQLKPGDVVRERSKTRLPRVGIIAGAAVCPTLRREKKFQTPGTPALNYRLHFEGLNKTLERINMLTRCRQAIPGAPSFPLPDSARGPGKGNPRRPHGTTVSPEVFTTPFTNPVGRRYPGARPIFGRRSRLFREAGYELAGPARLVNAKTGEPTFDRNPAGQCVAGAVRPSLHMQPEESRALIARYPDR